MALTSYLWLSNFAGNFPFWSYVLPMIVEESRKKTIFATLSGFPWYEHASNKNERNFFGFLFDFSSKFQTQGPAESTSKGFVRYLRL